MSQLYSRMWLQHLSLLLGGTMTPQTQGFLMSLQTERAEKNKRTVESLAWYKWQKATVSCWVTHWETSQRVLSVLGGVAFAIVPYNHSSTSEACLHKNLKIIFKKALESIYAKKQLYIMWACLSVLLCKVPCLLRLFSRFEELPERLSMELECVHWDRRDWGWGGSLRDRPPTSMQFTFMFGFSPAEHKTQESFVNICTNKNKYFKHTTQRYTVWYIVLHIQL